MTNTDRSRTVLGLQIATAIGMMCAALGTIAGTRRGGHAQRCAEGMSPPFQYAIGCTNRPIRAWRTRGHFGRSVIARACAQCLAMRAADQVDPGGHQARLDAVLDAAGIADYRTWRRPAA